MTVRETVNATKQRYGADALAELLDGATRVVVAKGKKVVEFVPGEDDDEALAAAVLGPSGNLRAPSIRAGRTWFVGFSEAAWSERFG